MTAIATQPRRSPSGPAGTAAGRREVLVFRVAMGLIALGVADDAFVHREPGSAASEHLLSGLVPIALAATLAFAYPRLRPGLRAIAGLVCGTLAVTAGAVDGLRHIAVDRVAGAAVDFLRGRPDADGDRIGGLGLSVGGELLLEAAARTRSLRAVVSEGAGVRSLAEHLHTPGVGRVQRWFSNWVAQTAALTVLGDASPPDDLKQLVGSVSPRPVLLIEAAQGAGGEELNQVYLEAAGPTASLWQARGGHTGAQAAQPAEYERRVIGFLDRAPALTAARNRGRGRRSS